MLKFLSPKQTNALVLRHYVVITLMHLNIHSPEGSDNSVHTFKRSQII